MIEIWKDIPEFEGSQASNTGLIRTIDRKVIYSTGSVRLHKGCIRKPHIANGYYRLKLCLNGTTKMQVVHRLVAKTFIPNPLNKPQVNHKDGNKLNNCVDNLEWCTALENNTHAIETGLKTKNSNAIIDEEMARKIKDMISYGLALTTISKAFDLSYYIVADISRKKTWTHV